MSTNAATEPIADRLADDVTAVVEGWRTSGSSPVTLWAELFDAGLAYVANPTDLGGREVSVALQEIVDEQLTELAVPLPDESNLVGVRMVAPILQTFGDDQQRELIRPAYMCETIWCQLFSEPGAGSDLASVTTSAIREGQRWRVRGQKVWTTMAHRADLGLCLARTSSEEPLHRGLTMFIVDMRSPGIQVRPIRQISGLSEYNEVFLDDVLVPDSNRVGDVGRGWAVTVSTLSSERSVLRKLASPPAMRRLRSDLVDTWAAASASCRSAAHRDRVLRSWAQAQVVELLGERLRGGRGVAAERDALPALGKLAYTGLAQQAARVVVDLQGPHGMLVDNYDNVQPASFAHMGGGTDPQGHPVKVLLEACGLSIGGGTTEVNKNIVGERGLGLPRSP